MNPWDKFMATYHVGDVANVRIVKLMTFGAFAEVVPLSLIHICPGTPWCFSRRWVCR